MSESDEQPTVHSSRSTCGTCVWWRLPLMLALVLAAIVVFQGRGIRVDEQESAATHGERVADGQDGAETVSLAIDFGDGAPLTVAPQPWRAGMTVADLLAAAREESQTERLNYVIQGRGASAFLTEIGGVANLGAGGANWTYVVNGTRADRSFAIYELAPDDQVLWTFSPNE